MSRVLPAKIKAADHKAGLYASDVVLSLNGNNNFHLNLKMLLHVIHRFCCRTTIESKGQVDFVPSSSVMDVFCLTFSLLN